MRVVVFTSRLAGRTGGEINVRDWTSGLKARGHDVVAYAPVLGPLADEIRALGIAVIGDPASMAEAPDVMFGSGINEVAALAARFPAVPLLQVSQQWDNWASFPSPLSQVALHVAVDAINAGSLVNEFGIPRDRVRIIHNAVDVHRIPPREHPLGKKPRSALVFVKRNDAYVDAVQRACAARGITAAIVGPGAGAEIADLSAMAAADLVVGSARIAIEAAAAGAAVLVADHRGLAGLLTTVTLDQFRQHNFGRAVLTRTPDEETIGAEFDRYDDNDAAAVTRTMREIACLDRQIDQIETALCDAVTMFRTNRPSEDASRRALATYLARHLPRDGEPSPRHSLQTQSIATPEAARLVDQLAQIVGRLSAIETARDDMASKPSPSAALTEGRLPPANLLANPESLERHVHASAIAKLERHETAEKGTAVYRITATGGLSEHYIVHRVASVADPVTFSLEARPGGTSTIRIQLIDDAQNVVYADFDFMRESFTLGWHAEASRRNGGYTQERNGWYRLWITAVLPAAHNALSLVVQLSDRKGQFTFEPGGESVLVRSLQVERGEMPSRYPRTPLQDKLRLMNRWRALRTRLPRSNPESARRRDVFTGIFEQNQWSNPESVSGHGSTVARTIVFRDDLERLVRHLRVRTLLDVPCGDFNWLRHSDLGIEQYIGVDIVRDLIARNREKYGSRHRQFLVRDMVCDDLPFADLILCRDGLVHLSYPEILETVRNFKRSGSTWLLTTSFISHAPNRELPGWHPLNLQVPPFSFPAPLRLIDERCVDHDGAYRDKHLALWKLSELEI